MLQITPWANLILGVDQRIVCSYINTILKLELDCRKNIANNKQFSICIYSCYSSTESWKYHPSPHFTHCCHLQGNIVYCNKNQFQSTTDFHCFCQQSQVVIIAIRWNTDIGHHQSAVQQIKNPPAIIERNFQEEDKTCHQKQPERKISHSPLHKIYHHA